MGLSPRPYQVAGVNAVEAAWGRGMRRPAVVWPTGTGKTVGFSLLAQRFLGRFPGQKVLVLAHRRELIDQAAGKLHDVAPELRTGIIKAHQNETLADVLVASVQTLRDEKRRLMLRDVGLIIVDECHHVGAPTYLEILRHFGALAWPDGTYTRGAVAAGFTATMVRGDRKALGDVWQDVVHSMTIAEAIHDGFLVRPRGKRVRVDDLDLSQVRRTGGDYRADDLGAALADSLAPEVIAKAVVEHAEDRPTILFAPTVASANIIGTAVADAGRSVGHVNGAMAAEARRSVLSDFKSGQIDLVTNCMVLTEGFDEPKTSCIVIARPTTQVGLYVQMVGRGLRPYPGKSDALVLDVVGASQRHALTSPIDLFGEDVLDKPEADPDEDLDDLDEVTAADGLGLERDEVYATGPIVAEDVDLFHGSTSAWLRTYGGTWFLGAGERFIAIVPGVAAGTWDVTAMATKQRGTGRWVMRGVTDLSYAMAWAEGEVTPAETTTAKRERGWRRRDPSDKQLIMARRCGVVVPEGATMGEVSNMISVAIASSRMDPITARMLASYGRAT
jgi:superfamily II DNA or RNA helicase